MLKHLRERTLAWLGAAVLGAFALALGALPGQAAEPLRIGFGMALTGPLAPNGKCALLGRPVQLVYYDDKSSPSEVPAIYTKLLDVDHVDLIVGGYATNMLAPAMPVVMQKNRLFIGMLGLAVNKEFDYPKYFVMIPSGPDPKPAFTKGFFDVAMAQDPKPQTVAIVGADAEFSRNASDGAHENAKAAGLKIVYDRNYPPAQTDFGPIVRAMQATNPDLAVICSYPLDSVGMVRAVNEIGFKPKMIGGGMVGLQASALKTQLGPLGYYMAPWGYAYLQVLGQAVEATKSLDDDKLADYVRNTTFTTVVGDVKFGKGGEWAQSRVLQVQFQHIKGNSIDQFRDISTQVVVAPDPYKSGSVIYPYEKAKE